MPVSFLPSGLDLVPDERPPIEVKIVQADESQPWFVVSVNRVTVDQFRQVQRSIAAQAPTNGRVNAKHQAKMDEDFRERYARKVFAGWSGLTIPNFNAIKSANVRLGGDREKELVTQKWELPFSVEAAAWLLGHTWDDEFYTPIFNALKRGAEDAIEEDDEKKAD